MWRSDAYLKFFDFLDTEGVRLVLFLVRLTHLKDHLRRDFTTRCVARYFHTFDSRFGLHIYPLSAGVTRPYTPLARPSSRARTRSCVITLPGPNSPLLTAMLIAQSWTCSQHFFNEIGMWAFPIAMRYCAQPGVFVVIGYRHVSIAHCPAGPAHARGRCQCNVTESFGAFCLSPA